MVSLADKVETILKSELGMQVFGQTILDRTLRAFASELRLHHEAHTAGFGWLPVRPSAAVEVVEYVIGEKWAILNHGAQKRRPLTSDETRSCVELVANLIRARFPELAWKYSARRLERSLHDYHAMRSKMFKSHI
jgi:hypothetical protein